MTAAEYAGWGGSAPYIAGPYAYTLAAASNDQRAGTAAVDAMLQLTRLGTGSAQLCMGAVNATNGTYGLVTASQEISQWRSYAGDGTAAQEVANITVKTSAAAAGNVAAGIEFRTRASGGSVATKMILHSDGMLTQKPPASATPISNGDLVFQFTSNTSVTLKLKGSDGVVRSTVLTLA